MRTRVPPGHWIPNVPRQNSSPVPTRASSCFCWRASSDRKRVTPLDITFLLFIVPSGQSKGHKILPDTESLRVSLGLHHPARPRLGGPCGRSSHTYKCRVPSFGPYTSGAEGPFLQQGELRPCPRSTDRRSCLTLCLETSWGRGA